MARLSAVLRSVQGGHAHFCPGCDHAHIIPNRWGFDGNVERPTFTPSVRVYTPAVPSEGIPEETLCHYFVRGGRIEFCGDCQHALAGQTVEMPDWPADYGGG